MYDDKLSFHNHVVFFLAGLFNSFLFHVKERRRLAWSVLIKMHCFHHFRCFVCRSFGGLKFRDRKLQRRNALRKMSLLMKSWEMTYYPSNMCNGYQFSGISDICQDTKFDCMFVVLKYSLFSRNRISHLITHYYILL